PHDNAVAEAFFSILKCEELSHNWYNTPEDLENTLQEYIDFFNRKRPHRKLKLQTPDQFEENYLISLASNC
ncbi:MAG: integrase core domain-containing protein, partial [Lentisphaeria bacterium]|nr:integrase core domain-containing protein [Lentisphaeria bacterium]